MYSPLHCCNLFPKAGTNQLRYHSVPVGFGAGVRDAFSSAKVIETRKGADFRLVCLPKNSLWGIVEEHANKSKKKQGGEGKESSIWPTGKCWTGNCHVHSGACKE